MERLESYPLLFTLLFDHTFVLAGHDKVRHVRLARFSLGLGGRFPGRASMGEREEGARRKLCSACSKFTRCMLQSTVLVCDNASSSIDPDGQENLRVCLTSTAQVSFTNDPEFGRGSPGCCQRRQRTLKG
jgi:hypothetical protein